MLKCGKIHISLENRLAKVATWQCASCGSNATRHMTPKRPPLKTSRLRSANMAFAGCKYGICSVQVWHLHTAKLTGCKSQKMVFLCKKRNFSHYKKTSAFVNKCLFVVFSECTKTPKTWQTGGLAFTHSKHRVHTRCKPHTNPRTNSPHKFRQERNCRKRLAVSLIIHIFA